MFQENSLKPSQGKKLFSMLKKSTYHQNCLKTLHKFAPSTNYAKLIEEKRRIEPNAHRKKTPRPNRPKVLETE